MAAERIDGSDWRDGFLFVGNHLALDFLNTRPVLEAGPAELLSDFGTLLRWFRAAGLLHGRQALHLMREWGGDARAARLLREVRELRERLRKQVLAWEEGEAIRDSTIAELNRWMMKHPMLTRLEAYGANLTMELWFQPVEPEDLIAPLAHAAASLFAEADRTRVRKCDQCVLHFYDTSKKGTRRWCSMRLCGNRVKVAAYAARHREG